MEKKKLTTWRVIGIGTMAGFCASFIIFSVMFLVLLSVPDYKYAATGGLIGSMFGIIGAIIGNYFNKVTQGAWIGGTIAPLLLLAFGASLCQRFEHLMLGLC